MRIKTIFIFLFLLLTHELFSVDILISTTLNKSEYIVGEPVFLEIEAINKSNASFAFDPFSYDQIIVKDAHAKIFERNLLDLNFYYENFQPGDTFRTWVDLTSEYGKKYNNSGFLCFSKGDYSVFIDFKDPEKKVSTTTEELYFKVKEPDPLHQEILDKLVQAKIPTTSWEEAISIYDRLIRDFPKNPYSAIIYYRRLLKEKFNEKAKLDQFRELCLKAIYELPANPYVTSYIGTLISHYRKADDKDNLEGTLQRIIQDNLSDRTTAFAKRMYHRIHKASFEEFMKNEY